MVDQPDRSATEADVIAAVARRWNNRRTADLVGLGHASHAPAKVALGIGDDAAVLDWQLPPGTHQLVTTDLLIEGIHFDLRLASLADVGWKALAVNLSDIAAMGGTPHFAVGTLGLPPGCTVAQVELLLSGIDDLLSHAGGITIIGGDTVASPQWQIGFTALGSVAGDPLRRNGAQPGDLILTDATLGMSQVGFHTLCALSTPTGSAIQHSLLPQSTRAHLRPVPQAGRGASLLEFGATACIDLSDSLAQTLLHVARASGVGLRLDFRPEGVYSQLINFVQACNVAAGRRDLKAPFTVPGELTLDGTPLHFGTVADFLLASAEDYGLIFTGPQRVSDGIASGRGAVVSLGTVVDAAAGCTYIDESGAEHELVEVGWQHR